MAQEIDPTLARIKGIIDAKVASGAFSSAKEAADIFEEFAQDREAKLKWLREQLDEAEAQIARGETVPLEQVMKSFQQ